MLKNLYPQKMKIVDKEKYNLHNFKKEKNTEFYVCIL